MFRSLPPIVVALAGLAAAGCFETRRPLQYLGRAELTHYKDVVTQIEYPVLDEDPLGDAELVSGRPPRRLREFSRDEIWDLTLEDALHVALGNSEVLRTRGQFLSPGNPILASPDQAPSVFDPAIRDTGVLFGGRGVEAALSDFDARFTTSALWGRNEQVQNNRFLSGGLAPGDTLADESAAVNARLEKNFANGGLFAVNNTWNYSGNNAPGRLFPSVYTGLLQAEYRQPLLAGAGVEFTRIAGPVSTNIRGISGVQQGVLISRINDDISLAQFEASVRNLLKDVEDLYWDLALAYYVYDAQVASRDATLRRWQEVKARLDLGVAGAGAADEAQAREAYYETRDLSENALAELYSLEAQLRRMLGLPVNDGRIIRPADAPTAAEFVPDWPVALAEALTARVELRQQKWNIKSLELQLRAARNLSRPRLDFVSNYQVNAFGDRLFAGSDDDRGGTPQGLDSAVESLTQGDQTGWNLGFEFSLPVGLRLARSQVRNAELKLAKARTLLAEQEREISHELAAALQRLDRAYQAIETNDRRRQASLERVRATEEVYLAGREPSIDLLLRAELALAQSRIAYARSLVDYNKAIADVHYRQGSLLEQDNVFLAEAPWDAAGYRQALRRAWSRSYAFDARGLHAEPPEFVYPDGYRPDYAYPLEPPPEAGAPTPLPPLPDDAETEAGDAAPIAPPDGAEPAAPQAAAAWDAAPGGGAGVAPPFPAADGFLPPTAPPPSAAPPGTSTLTAPEAADDFADPFAE